MLVCSLKRCNGFKEHENSSDKKKNETFVSNDTFLLSLFFLCDFTDNFIVTLTTYIDLFCFSAFLHRFEHYDRFLFVSIFVLRKKNRTKCHR